MWREEKRGLFKKVATRKFSRCFISLFSFSPLIFRLLLPFFFFYFGLFCAPLSLSLCFGISEVSFSHSFTLIYLSCVYEDAGSPSFWFFSSIFHYVARYSFAFASCSRFPLCFILAWLRRCMLYLIILETTWLRTHMLYVIHHVRRHHMRYIITLFKHSCMDFPVIYICFSQGDASFCSANILH